MANSNPSTLSIYEIFEELEEVCIDDEDKITFLREKAGNKTFTAVLQGIYRDDIRFVFTEIPKYHPSQAPLGFGYTNLYIEMDRIYLFVEGSRRVDPNLSLKRKEEILIQILESMDRNESKVLEHILLKKPIAGLTLEIVKEALPELF